MTDPTESKTHFYINRFWAELAKHLLSKKSTPFLTEYFIELTTVSEFALALSFLDCPAYPKYSLNSDNDFVVITAEEPFMLFVKEAKPVEYNRRADFMINQSFYDPANRYEEREEGQPVQ